jgi:hypothetical protein
VQPLKLVIPGAYWDCQLYQGWLYLFGRSGDILTLDWDALIGGMEVEEPLALALNCAFQRSDYLYGAAAAGLIANSEIREVISRQFSRLQERPLEVSAARVRKLSVGQQDNPLPFPHTDSEIYARKLYVSSKSGVNATSCNKRTKLPVSTRPQKVWDAPCLGISASYGSLALAAGSEGLFEKTIIAPDWTNELGNGDPKHLSSDHCSDCGWAFYSIYGSSSLGHGRLVSYVREEMDDDTRTRRRRFDRIVPDDEIFGPEPRGTETSYSWASQDKLCRATDGLIDVARYEPWKEQLHQRIERIGSLTIEGRPRSIVSATVALFGTVIELDSSVVIIPSSGPTVMLNGEPVNWRVFPRSKHYENHLHVVYDDHLAIFSFNHDYLVNQDRKVSGVRHFGRRGDAV